MQTRVGVELSSPTSLIRYRRVSDVESINSERVKMVLEWQNDIFNF